MRTVSVNAGQPGFVTYWSLGETSNASLVRHAFASVGLEHLAPNQRTDQAALKVACLEQVANRDILILPLKDRTGFEAVLIRHGEERNEHVHQFSVNLEGEGEYAMARLVSGYADMPQIRDLYRKAKGELPAGSVGSALADAARHLRASTLRESGGFYWLPGHVADTWVQLAQAVEQAGNNKVWRLNVTIDGDCIKAVTDALIREVTADVERIKEDLYTITDDEAVGRRRLAAIALHEKVKDYETIMSASLPELHKAIETAEQMAVLAAMQSLAALPGGD